MAGDIIVEKLGVEFRSIVAPDFAKNVQTAIDQFNQNIQPSLKAIASQFKAIGASVSTFFELLKSVPAGDIFKGWNVQGATDKMSASFKTAKDQSLKYVEELSTGIKAKLRDLEREYEKNQKIMSSLARGEDIITDWGQKTWSKDKGKYYFKDPKWAVGTGPYDRANQSFGLNEADTNKLFGAVTASYQDRQLTIYKEMETILGRMGAFERARLATDELIARANQEEIDAKSKIAEVSKIIDVLRSKGLTVEGKDDKYFSSAKKHLEDIWSTTKDINILNQEAEAVISRICGSEEALKKIILERFEIEGKLVTLATQMANEYERAKATSFTSFNVTGLWTKGDLNVDSWQRLIGYIEQAKGAVSSFQQNIQAVQMKAFIDPNELQRINSLTSVLNSEIDALSNRLAKIGSQTGAKAIAEPFVALEAQITKVESALAAAQASGKGGAVIYTDLDATVRKLANDLKELAASTKLWRIDEIRAGMGVLDTQIKQLSGGAELSYKSLKKMGMGMLEVEEIQSLLGTKMKLIREEFALTGVATTAMNTEMNKSTQAMVALRSYAGEVEKRTGDAARAMQRWSVEGFGNMLKSQLAWLAGGALIFGTIFKIQQAFREALSTILKFNQAIIDVGAITEASATEMGILEKAARDVAKTTKMGFMESAEALKILGQAGLTATQSAEVLRTVAKLVTATGASSQEAVKVLTTAINVWGLSAKEATRVGNVLAAALNYSKLEVNDLAVAFNYVAAIGSQVGMSIEEVAGTIAVLANAGIRASTIGTGLRGILGQLIAPTKAFREELDAVGLRFTDVQMPGKNLVEVLRTLQKAGFDLGNIFEGLEKRQAGALAAMLNMGAAAFAEMTERITGTNAMMVMFERSMEGPEARLRVFKTNLLDVALSTTNVVVPSLTMFLKILRELVETFKLLWPVFIGGAVIAGIQYLIKQFDLLALGAGKLHVVLTFLQAHPILKWLSLLTAVVTGAKLAYDGLHKSNDETIKTHDRELSLLGRKIMDFEKLNAILKEGNLSREEMNNMISEMAASHKELNDAIRSGQLEEKELGKVIEEVLKKTKQQFDDLKLTRFTALATALENEQSRFDKIKMDFDRRYQEWSKQNPGKTFTEFLEKTQLGKTFDEQRKAVEDADEALRSAARGMKGYTEDTIREIMANGGLSRSLSDLASGYVNVYKTIEKGTTYRTKATSEELKSLKEWQLKAAEDLDKLRLERKRELDAIGDTALLEGDALVKAYQRKAYINNYYNEKEKELREKQFTEKAATEKRIQGYMDELYRDDIKNRMKEAKDESDELIRVDKVLAVEKAEVWENYLKRRDAIISDKDLLKDPSRRGTVLASTFEQLTKNLGDKEDAAERERQKIREKRQTERLDRETKFANELLRIDHEIVQNEIAVAKSEADKIAGEEKTIDLAYKDAEEKHKTNLANIKAERTKVVEKPGLSYEELFEIVKNFDTLLAAEDKRYWSEKNKIFDQGVKTISDLLDNAEQKRISDLEKNLKIEADQRTQADKQELDRLQEKYDTLASIDRDSEYGKKLKNRIDSLTVSITKNTIELYENAKAFELLQKNPNAELILRYDQEIDRLTEKLRTARRAMADHASEYGTLIEGMEAGLKQFSTSLDSTFDIGRKAVVDFGKTLKDSTGGVLSDLMTGEMKSWKDFWLNLLKDIGRNFSKMINEMIWDWLGFKKATTGPEFNLGALLGGLLGKIFPSLNTGSGTIAAPGEWVDLSAVHGGGFPRYHSGGLGRDEILALLLKKEYVLRPQATQSIGKDRLDYMNATGQIPQGRGGKSKIEVEVSLEPGLLASVRPSAEEIDLTVATKYHMGGHLYKQLHG